MSKCIQCGTTYYMSHQTTNYCDICYGVFQGNKVPSSAGTSGFWFTGHYGNCKICSRPGYFSADLNRLCADCYNKHNENIESVNKSIKEESKGKKNDQEKPDLSLIPTDALWEMGKAFTYGSNKYGRHNFREGIEISRLLAASMRHITQFNEGEDYDEESGALHLGNAMAGLAMAIFMYKNRPKMDNRWKKK